MPRPTPLAALALVACTHAPARPLVAPPVAAIEAVAPAVVDGGAPDAGTSATPERVCRSALAMPAPRVPARERAAAPRAPTSPAVRRACEAYTRVARRGLDPLREEFDEPILRARVFDPLTACADAGDGAWVFAVTVGRPRPGTLEHERVHPVTVRPVYVTSTGVARPSERSISLVLGTAHFAHTTSVSDVGVFDWDGDGRAELYFRELHEQEENNTDASRSTRWWTFTATGARAPREFAREAARASSIDDVDLDGRPDLRLRSPWVVTGPCGLSDVDYPGPEPLLHSIAGGRFVEDDVSHAWLARQCDHRSTSFYDGLGRDEDLGRAGEPPFRVACARIYGASADEVAAEVARTRPPDEPGHGSSAQCFPLDALVQAARVDPPGAFRLACDAP